MSKIEFKVLNKAVIQIGSDNNHVNVTLHRTLRIPDDVFPVCKVEDYRDKVPKEWLKTGGVFFPLYQREAMWMQFHEYCKEGKRPKAVKVGVGKINCVSGKPWNTKLKKGVTDYVIVPDQKWLDGINSGDGFIKQFVAMPLGSGYTVEGQIRGEEKFGGIQLCMYDSKKVLAPHKKKITYKRPPEPIPEPFPVPTDPFFPPPPPGLYPAPVPCCCECDDSSGMNFQQSISMPSVRREASVMRSSGYRKKKKMVEKGGEKKRDFGGGKEMGIAAGGKIKQKVIDDKYGFENWDTSNFGELYIRIVNSEMYEKITGDRPPETEISAETYTAHDLPWYDFYEEKEVDVKASKLLSKVKTVKELDKENKVETPSFNPELSVDPKNVKVIPNDNEVGVGKKKPVVTVEVVPKPKDEVPEEELSADLRKKLALLEKMGFEDKALNLFMLKKHNGNIQKVASLLVQYNMMK